MLLLEGSEYVTEQWQYRTSVGQIILETAVLQYLDVALFQVTSSAPIFSFPLYFVPHSLSFSAVLLTYIGGHALNISEFGESTMLN